VGEEPFQRLAEGQHPLTGEPLVRQQRARAYINARGEHVTARAHRAGWDATFSAPKSVSLTALVGGDERVRAAHRESVAVALDEMERYVQARIGHTIPPRRPGRGRRPPSSMTVRGRSTDTPRLNCTHMSCSST
jgi:TrwC relaxase